MNPEIDEIEPIVRINLALRASTRARAKEAAEARGETLERFITRAILTALGAAAPAHPTPAEMRAARDAKRANDSVSQPKRRR